MIKIDYAYSSIKLKDLLKYQKKINKMENDFNLEAKENDNKINYSYEIDQNLINDIKKEALKQRKINDVFVVCAIGGSSLGSKAVIEALKTPFEENKMKMIYLGESLDENEIQSTLKYLKNKDFGIVVISKSGGTMETLLVFNLLRDLLIEKYKEESRERIILITNEFSGKIKKMSVEKGYKTYFIPSEIVGRYSVVSVAGLFPMAVAGIDIESFIEGTKKATTDFQKVKIENNYAYQYAIFRYINYIHIKNKLELLVSYDPSLFHLQQWWVQLFAESEGKNGLGLYPTTCIFSSQLHSVGQYIQEGPKILFETIINFNKKSNLKIKESKENIDGLNHLKDKSFGEINNIIMNGSCKAHFEKSKINNIIISFEKLDAKSLGYSMYFFMKACVASSRLLKVNPFNQPGVEVYKKEVIDLLNKK